MSATVLVCGKLFDGTGDRLVGPVEVLVEQDRVAEIAPAVARPAGAKVVDLTDRTVTPGFIESRRRLRSIS